METVVQPDDEYDRIVCQSIESLLNVATGRAPLGNLDDVLLRLIGNSSFFHMASFSEPLDSSDVQQFANAIWSVLTSKGMYEPLRIRSTIPGISGETWRNEFVKKYARELVVEAPVAEIERGSTQSPQLLQEIRAKLEEYLVSIIALYCVQMDCDCFSVYLFFPTLRRFFHALHFQSESNSVCEKLLDAMSTVEEVSRHRDSLELRGKDRVDYNSSEVP